MAWRLQCGDARLRLHLRLGEVVADLRDVRVLHGAQSGGVLAGGVEVGDDSRQALLHRAQPAALAGQGLEGVFSMAIAALASAVVVTSIRSSEVNRALALRLNPALDWRRT